MRKKILLIIVAVSFLMLHSDILIGQQGVLLPKKKSQPLNTEGHVHDENCNHEDEKDAC